MMFATSDDDAAEHVSRRDFVRASLATGGGMLAGATPVDSSSAVDDEPQQESGQADEERRQPVSYQMPSGEPYELAGKRMAFTSWFHVRPGSFAWVDDAGNNVTVSGSQGPWGAHFQRSDYPHGIHLVAEPAERRGPIISRERSWEKTGISVNTLIKEDGRYRLWAGCSGDQGTRSCYFESDDGLHWQRPDLGLVDIDGEGSNLLAQTIGTVFVDPSAPAEETHKYVHLSAMSYEDFERYKGRRPNGWEIRARREDVGHVYFIQGGVSADGINWTVLPEPLVVEHSDTQIVAYYDQRLGKYVIYTRNWCVGQQSEGAEEGWGSAWWTVGRRSIGRTESNDFRRFPPSELIIVPPSHLLPSDVLYTNCRTAVPGAPDHHLLFPTVWHTGDDSTSVVMASSHDGKAWTWVPGGSVFSTGPFGEWDGGCVFANPNLTELPDGDFVLPYTGYRFPHKYPRGQWEFQPGYMVWPKGRVVAIEARELGEFATVAIMPPGRKLLVNALTQRAGKVVVEVADINGAALAGRSFAECDPIVGDQHRTAVTWQGDDIAVTGDLPIILRVKMDHAKLYWFEFASG